MTAECLLEKHSRRTWFCSFTWRYKSHRRLLRTTWSGRLKGPADSSLLVP